MEPVVAVPSRRSDTLAGVGVVSAYALLAMSTQLLWLTFAAITPESARSMGVSEGAVGDLYMLKQLEKHSGPHSDWFYDVNQSGGGALMDMGCHAFAWFRWMLGGKPRVRSVWATMQTVLHGNRTTAEDNSVAVVEFDGGVIGLAEDSWAKLGGMDDRIEVYGKGGYIEADLFRGNAALTYSDRGYGYALEKAGSTQGWTFTIFEEVFNQGYPHELQHFVQCSTRHSRKRMASVTSTSPSSTFCWRRSRSRDVCRRSGSSISRPTWRSGSSEPRASCITKPMREPRSSRHWRPPRFSRSWPSKARRRARICAPAPVSPARVREVTLLPEPDSPTRARHSPG